MTSLTHDLTHDLSHDLTYDLTRGRYGPVVRIYTIRCGDSSSPSLYGDAILVVWSGLDLYPP